MDPASWTAYSQHLSRLGASMNPPSGSLSQTAQLNELGLSSAIPRQDHLGSYGNAGGPHPFLLAASHGLNPSQAASRGEHSFNASSLFVANYDASLLSASFQPSNKGHLPTFPQGAGFFKAVGRDNDFADLRTGFAHCGMAPYARNPEGNGALSGTPGLGSNALFPNSMPSGSWRPPGIMPSSCGPFGILPHEAVLQRPHLVRRGEKQQSSKSSRSSHSAASFMEQDLSRSYRGILSSPARPPSSFMDHNNVNHPSLLSPQNDPYFSSVTDSYYSSCSKSDFGAYSSYCSNMQSAVQRNALSPYCYSQSFGPMESSGEKQEHSSAPCTTASASANSSYSNAVPNNNFSRSHAHQQNGLVSRQTVITSNTNSAPAAYDSQHQEGHPRHSYSQRDAYNYPPGSLHSGSSLPVPLTNSGPSNATNGRPVTAHSGSGHYSSLSQTHYPPMSTPIPAATPAHPTPPSSMGQAHVPTLVPMNHDSGCSSGVYNSPSNDACYSTPGTCHSGSTAGSPAKQDISQHSSPSMYSVESSNMSINNSPFVDPNRIHSRTVSDASQGNVLGNPIGANDAGDSTNKSGSKILDGNLPATDPNMISSDCTQQPPSVEALPALPLDATKMNKAATAVQRPPPPLVYENHSVGMGMPDVHTSHPNQYSHCEEALASRTASCSGKKSEMFPFPPESPPAIDYTQPKTKHKSKRMRKKKADCFPDNCYPQSFNYPPRIHDLPPLLPPQSHASAVPVQDGSPGSDISSLPVDLSHVSLNLTTKKDKSPMNDSGISEKCHEVPDLNYEHSILSSSWPVASCDGSIPVQMSSSPRSRLLPEDGDNSKGDPHISSGHSIDDLSNESKNKLVNNLDDDLGFLAELSATSDVDDGTSKESFSEKKGKKQHGFLQSFLTFLESSNEPTAASETESKPTEKLSGPDKCGSPDLAVLDSKDDEGESHWLLDKTAKKETNHVSCSKSNSEKVPSISMADDKDNFEEAPSLDSGLFGCSTLQKEMVVPNPEAPSFSSDEDENSAQGIFDSVAMAIQRLCDDNEEDNREKRSDDDKQQGKCKSVQDKVDSNNEDSNTLVSEAVPEKVPGSIIEDKLPTLVVRQKKGGKRKRGRHLFVIKVNRVKKQNADGSHNMKISNKSRKKPSRSNAKTKVTTETRAGNSARQSLMRKCKQKRFQRNCESKRKKLCPAKPIVLLSDVQTQLAELKKKGDFSSLLGKPRPCKRKHGSDDGSLDKDVVVVDDEDSNRDKNKEPQQQQEVEEKKEESPVVETVKLSIVSSELDATDVSPKKVRKASKRRHKKKKRWNRQKSEKVVVEEPEVVEEEEEEEEAEIIVEKEIILPHVEKETVPSVIPVEGQDTVLRMDSTNCDETSRTTEIRFKTGDYVTSADCSGTDSPPIWRIEGKNVLQLFEMYEFQESGFLYKNTSSYSRWSPSSKYKYSKLNVNVIKCDDDTVIIEMPKKSLTSDCKDISGLSPVDSYVAHPQRENFEVYLQTLVSHALDPDFIPEIVKENDEYFLSHLRAIEKFMSEKKESLLVGNKWDCQLQSSAEAYPFVSVSMRKDEEKKSCELCNSTPGQYMMHFHGQLYDIDTLENKVDSKGHPVCDWKYILCGTCVQRTTLYNRLHHHKFHFYQLGCKKVKDVSKGSEKDSHAILEECLQDSRWMTRMFADMMELWNACDKFR